MSVWGIGKSTLAAALAHDPEVQDRFPDGVLWATLGQQPELMTHLSDWVQQLGDFNFKPLSVEAISGHLRTRLAQEAALLVVDDVWDPDHVSPFLVGGPRCRVLITTRRASVADVAGAGQIWLDVLLPSSPWTSWPPTWGGPWGRPNGTTPGSWPRPWDSSPWRSSWRRSG